MTPTPDSPQFIVHKVPDYACAEAKTLEKVFFFIKNKARNNNWFGIKEEDVSLTYNLQTQKLTLEIGLTDYIGVKHKCLINHIFYDMGYSQNSSVWCEYLFEGGNVFDNDIMSVKSFAEYVMLLLWREGLDAELSKCDRGLFIQTSMGSAYPIFCKLLDLVVSNLKPKEWYLDIEPIWQFRKTYAYISELLLKIKKEARNNRWKGVRDSNFYIMLGEYYAYLCLDYFKTDEYEQRIKIGLDINSFCNDDRHIECTYEFNVLTKDPSLKSYLYKSHCQFVDMINYIFGMVFTHNALFIKEENGFKVAYLKAVAFKKICLLLDMFVPIRDNYKGSELYEYPEQSMKSELNMADNSMRLFAGGYYKEPKFNENQNCHIDTSFTGGVIKDIDDMIIPF